MSAAKTLKIFLENPVETGSQRLLSQIRDNMKLFRSVSCEVVVWTKASSDSLAKIQQAGNYPFELHAAPELWVQIDSNSSSELTRQDRLELIEGDKLITTIEISSTGESIDLRSLIQALLYR